MNESKINWPTLIGAAVALGLIIGIVGHITGIVLGRDIEKRAAVIAGAAEYSADPKTGEALFRYKGGSK